MARITLTKLTADDREQFIYEGDDSGGMFRFEKVIDICHNKGYHI